MRTFYGGTVRAILFVVEAVVVFVDLNMGRVG